ncbi:MAG: arylsulfatase [Bryobacter sp.]|nr:arylsulfatase [Bryobacter sp.]
MNRRSFLNTLASTPLVGAAAAQNKKPNIVLIMSDDMGYSDPACFGSEIRTPNIDRLAKNGVKFTQFYNTARCCPTRASLMTGLYAQQAGVGHMVDNPKAFPGYTGDLRRDTPTIAEALKPAGYKCYMSGKWHVTPVTASKHNWPRQRGFDRYFGIIHGASSFYDPVTLKLDNEEVDPEGKDFYLTDAFGQHAVKFIDEHRTDDPFFLYLPFTSPHWPMHALEEDIDRYRGRYKMGWDKLRLERHERMKQLGLVDPKWKLTPRDEKVPAWNDAPNKEWQQRRMEVYAAMIDRMDQNIGKVMGALERKGQLDNTLILFLHDNGGCAEGMGTTGNAIHFPPKTRDGRVVRRGNLPELMPGPRDTYQSYGAEWANTSNTPFRLYKHWVHEGGISTPLIAHWPAAVKNAGRWERTPGHLIDVMATAVDIAAAPKPKLMEGKSLAPILRGQRRAAHDALFWEHEGNRAVREGDWKLVSRFPGQWELYDLKGDRTEMNNVIAAQPKVAARLETKYKAWAQSAGVVDWETIRQSPRVEAPVPGGE